MEKIIIKEQFEERILENIPFDMRFVTSNGNEELCHATGVEVLINEDWYNEYIDFNGDLHYGR